MARAAKTHELAIAALGGALGMVTLLYMWERGSIEAMAKAVDVSRSDQSRDRRMFEPFWSYKQALGLMAPTDEGPNEPVGPIESDSPYDIFSPYLHNVPATRPPPAPSAPPPTRRASLRPAAPPKQPKTPAPPPPPPASASDFLVPDVSSLVIPAAALTMLTIPLIESGNEGSSNVAMFSSPEASSDPPSSSPQLTGPFHLFFTTGSPTGVAPVVESGGAAGTVISSTPSTLNETANSTTTTVTGLASSTGTTATGLLSSTTSTTTGLVSSVLRHH
jgi:hypothetical protein